VALIDEISAAPPETLTYSLREPQRKHQRQKLVSKPRRQTMFALMALFGIMIVAVIAVAFFAVAAKLILLPLRLLFLPLKLLALPFIAIALIVKFAFVIALGSIVVALLIPLAILALVIGAPIAIVASLT
jgi:hypothetical protein